MINKELLPYLCCPECKSDFREQDNFLVCKKCGEKYEIIDGNILKIIPNLTQDLELSIKKWDKFYQKQIRDGSYIKEKNNYLKNFFEDTYQQINEYKKINEPDPANGGVSGRVRWQSCSSAASIGLHSRGKPRGIQAIPNKELVYLEIGCGPMFFGQEIAHQCRLVIGIDFCPTALKIAKKMLKAKGIKNYLLIQGDILNMPLKENTVDLIYGGGVIEHFENTSACLNELYRVNKKNGVSFNTVPCLNIGSLTYRQIWGNIPNLPILKPIAEFIHLKLLKGKHLIFGYELSFLGSTLIKLHQKAGFREIYVDKFRVKLTFDFIPSKILKKLFIKLANSNRLFWPMIKIIAKK